MNLQTASRCTQQALALQDIETLHHLTKADALLCEPLKRVCRQLECFGILCRLSRLFQRLRNVFWRACLRLPRCCGCAPPPSCLAQIGPLLPYLLCSLLAPAARARSPGRAAKGVPRVPVFWCLHQCLDVRQQSPPCIAAMNSDRRKL
eukprot:7385790-Prymnesium_polylepis.1